MIRGTTKLIAHIGYPTESFKAPMIYNPFFERAGVDAVVARSNWRFAKTKKDRNSSTRLILCAPSGAAYASKSW